MTEMLVVWLACILLVFAGLSLPWAIAMTLVGFAVIHSLRKPT